MAPNAVVTDEESAWVNQFAGRLRLVWADGGAASPVQRREYVMEEIERGFRDVPAANQKRLLGALLARFPVAGEIVTSAPNPAAAPVAAAPAPQPPPKPETLEETLARFLCALAQAPEEQRRRLASQLFKSEFGSLCGGATETGVPDESRLALGLHPGQELRQDRVLQLAAQLLDNVCEIHRDAQKTLQSMAPNSPLLKKHDEPRKAAGRFLTGETDSVQAQFGAPAGSIHRLFKAMFAAMLGGGSRFERAYVAKFKPARISDIVDAEGVRPWQNRDALCWKKYVELADDYVKEGVIRKEIKECLGAFVDQVELGGR